MAKITKNQLKGIVKECLLEILSEGIGGTAQSSETFDLREQKSQPRQRRTQRHNPSLDSISFGSNEATDHRNKQMDNDVNVLTSDPIMASIFADTQSTTMLSQSKSLSSNMNESVSLQGDRAAKIMAQNDPMDVFSEASDKWAHLAFSDS